MTPSYNTKHFSSLQERTVSKYLGWSVVTGSGSRPMFQGDISGMGWLGECKTHIRAGRPIVFNWKVWTKICKEAAAKFANPILVVDDGSQQLANTWCMIYKHCIPDSVVDRQYSVRLTQIPGEFVHTSSISFKCNSANKLLALSDNQLSGWEYHKAGQVPIVILPISTLHDILFRSE